MLEHHVEMVAQMVEHVSSPKFAIKMQERGLVWPPSKVRAPVLGKPILRVHLLPVLQHSIVVFETLPITTRRRALEWDKIFWISALQNLRAFMA